MRPIRSMRTGWVLPALLLTGACDGSKPLIKPKVEEPA